MPENRENALKRALGTKKRKSSKIRIFGACDFWRRPRSAGSFGWAGATDGDSMDAILIAVRRFVGLVRNWPVVFPIFMWIGIAARGPLVSGGSK